MKKIIRIGIMLTILALLCSCSQTPNIGNGEKPDLLEDTFEPYTLEDTDKQLEPYEQYKKNTSSAFAELIPTAADEFEYTVTEDGVRIDKHIGQSEMVVIPSQIEGKAVTQIADKAFYIPDGQSNLRSIYVSDSVEIIGQGAFKDCSKLQLMRLPFVGDGVDNTHFGYIFGADKYDENAINVPVSLETVIIGKGEDAVADRAFYGAKSIDAVVLLGVESIGKFAFYECDQLCYISLSNTLESIGDYAFSSCTSLSKIELPKSVKSVGFGAFYMCKSMCDMTLSVIGDGEKNTHIGYIFGARTADWNEDFVPASLRRITLLDTCTRIENKAFANCTSIVQINFSDRLEFIGIRSFVNCRSIAVIDCPASLKTISGDAFFGCDNLIRLTVVGATKIQSQAFFGCDKLKNKSISASAEIADNAF